MKSYDIRTNIVGNSIKTTHIINVGSNDITNISLSSDIIKSTSSIGVLGFISFESYLSSGGQNDTLAEKSIGITQNVDFEQAVSASAETVIKKINCGFGVDVSNLTQSDTAFFINDSNHVGYFLPNSPQQYDTFALNGAIDKLDSSGISTFNGRTVYINLDNIENIAKQISQLSMSMYYIKLDGILNNNSLSIEIGIYDNYAIVIKSYNGSIYELLFNGIEWHYSQESINSFNLDNQMNARVVFSTLSTVHTEVYNESNIAVDLNKTIISSYPFDCSNMMDGLKLYTIFHYVNGTWNFITHTSSI